MPKSLPDGPGIALREGVHGETHGPKEPSPSWRNSSLLNMARCCSIAGQSLLRQTVRWPLVSVRLPCAGRWIKHDRTVDFDHSHKKIMFFGAVTFSVLFPQRPFLTIRFRKNDPHRITYFRIPGVPGLHFVPWHRGSGCLGAAAPVTGAAADEHNLNVVDCDTSVTVPRLVLKWGSGGYAFSVSSNMWKCVRTNI